MYVLRRIEDNKFVAKPGRKNSYTTSLQSARTFFTRAEAKEAACGNEFVFDVDDILIANARNA